MTEPISLGARRASSTDDPGKIAPRDLLLRVIDAIDSGELAPDHVIVLTAQVEPDGKTSSQLDHAGRFDRLGQMGLLSKGLFLLDRA